MNIWTINTGSELGEVVPVRVSSIASRGGFGYAVAYADTHGTLKRLIHPNEIGLEPLDDSIALSQVDKDMMVIIAKENLKCDPFAHVDDVTIYVGSIHNWTESEDNRKLQFKIDEQFTWDYCSGLSVDLPNELYVSVIKVVNMLMHYVAECNMWEEVNGVKVNFYNNRDNDAEMIG